MLDGPYARPSRVTSVIPTECVELTAEIQAAGFLRAPLIQIKRATDRPVIDEPQADAFSARPSRDLPCRKSLNTA